MARYKITVEGGDSMVTYITEPLRDISFIDDLTGFKAYALEVAKAMNMGKDPSITIEEIQEEK